MARGRYLVFVLFLSFYFVSVYLTIEEKSYNGKITAERFNIIHSLFFQLDLILFFLHFKSILSKIYFK